MINLVDLVIIVIALLFFVKNSGGILKTIFNLFIILAFITFFGMGVRALLNSSYVSGDARKTLENSFFVKLSHVIVAASYSPLASSAPKVDSFVKNNFLVTPEGSEIAHPENYIPSIQDKISKSKPK